MTLLHQEILPNTPAGSQYLRFGGVAGDPSAGDWRAQELKIAPELPTPARVPGVAAARAQCRCPKACTRRPAPVHTSLPPETIEGPALGALGSQSGQGRLLGTGHPQLPSGERQTALLLRRCRGPAARTRCAGQVRVHLGRGKSARGGTPRPRFPGPLFCSSPAQAPHSRHPQLPDAFLGRPGGWARAPRALPPTPIPAAHDPATYPAPGGAACFLRRVSLLCSSAGRSRSCGRGAIKEAARAPARAGAAWQGAVRRRHGRHCGQSRARTAAASWLEPTAILMP